MRVGSATNVSKNVIKRRWLLESAAAVASAPLLEIGRAYSAADAAAILGIHPSVLNERVREGLIVPIFPTGDRRYSGYALAKLLGWPLSEDPKDYMFRQDPLKSPVKDVGEVGKTLRRRVRIVR